MQLLMQLNPRLLRLMMRPGRSLTGATCVTTPGKCRPLRRRKTPILNLLCLAATSSLGKGFRSKPRGTIRSRSPLGQSVVDFNFVLAAPATALVPNCNGLAVPLNPSATWRGGICCMGNMPFSTSHCPGLHPITFTQLHTYTWRGHSSFALGVDTTRGAADTSYKLPLNWRRARRRGLLLTVGEVLGSQWTATARPSWAAPSQ